MRKFWLIIYYGLAIKLPKSTMPVFGRLAQRLRYKCVKHLFAVCKGSVNLEQGAYLGNGKNIHVLGNAGIGKDFYMS